MPYISKNEISEILFHHDPIGIGGIRRDEYDVEAIAIITKIRKVRSADEMHDMVHSVFRAYFGEQAGERDTYRDISNDICALVNSRYEELG